MVDEDDYFALVYSFQNEYKDLIKAATDLVYELCRDCKWTSCPNMDFCKYTKELRRVLSLFSDKT